MDGVDHFWTQLSQAWRRPRPSAKVPDLPYYRSVAVERSEPIRISTAAIRTKREASSGTVRDWASSAVQTRRNGSLPCVEARAAFERWCRASGKTIPNANAFGRQMTALGFKRKKRCGHFHYAGIVLAGGLRAVA
jgi:hypothetical protein